MLKFSMVADAFLEEAVFTTVVPRNNYDSALELAHLWLGRRQEFGPFVSVRISHKMLREE